MVKAFSIVEALIGLVVSALIIGIVFVVFNILSGQLLNLQNQNRLTDDANRLHWSLQKEIFESRKMFVSEGNPIFLHFGNDTVSFVSEDDYVLRKSSEMIDTFRIAQPHFEVDTVKTASQKRTFLKLELHFTTDKKQDTLGFYKEVYPSELIEHDKWQ